MYAFGLLSNGKTLIVGGLLLGSLLAVGCAPAGGAELQLETIVQAHRFSIAGWQLQALVARPPLLPPTSTGEVKTVIQYFDGLERMRVVERRMTAKAGEQGDDSAELRRLAELRDASRGAVEGIIEKQVREVLAGQGILNPLDRWLKLNVVFPPVNFKLERPPNLLVVSPRDRIERTNNILLRQDLTPAQMEEIEAKADELGVSSLVVGLGGLGATYPTFVTNEAGLRFTLDAVVEEWLHQYLAFKPLGFRYVLDSLGVRRSKDIADMNETLAGIVSREIGGLVYARYYSGVVEEKPAPPARPAFDFNREMRETRLAVDAFLARGEVEQAEGFMEARREYLATQGYYIRKLNQAYFAFHGSYGDSPASVNPIGVEMRQLRSRSASLKQFLDTVAGMTGREQLTEAVSRAVR